MLARIRLVAGSLDRVARVVKVLGMVNAAPDFKEQPKVINGFSDLMVEVFGEAGRGARAAVGMAALTGQMAVEIEMVIELKEEPTMTENTDAQIRHVYEQWHETIKVRDARRPDGALRRRCRPRDAVHPGGAEGQDRGHPERKEPPSGHSSRPDFASPKAVLAAGTGPGRSSPTAGSSSGNIRAKHRKAIRSIWSK